MRKIIRTRLLATGENDGDASTIMLDGILASKSGDASGMKWEVTVIAVGKTKTTTPTWVTGSSLQASLSAFENAKVYLNATADFFGHKTKRNEKVTRDVVGLLDKPHVEADGLHATLELIPSAKQLGEDLVFLASKGKLNLYQLSVDADIQTTKPQFITETGETLPVLMKIVKADVDIVGEAGAGGKFNRLAASHSNNTFFGGSTMKNKLLALFTMFYPTFLAAHGVVDLPKVNENELFTHLLAAGKGFIPTSLPNGIDLSKDDFVPDEKSVDAVIQHYVTNWKAAAAPDPAEPNSDGNAGNLDALTKQVKVLMLQASAGTVAAALTASKLPEATKTLVAARWNGKVVSQEEIDTDIKAYETAIAQFTEKHVDDKGLGIRSGVDSIDKFQAAMIGMILASGERIEPARFGTPAYEAAVGKDFAKIDPFRSIREAYILATGDTQVTGRVNKRLLGSIDTAQFPVVVENALNKALVLDYNKMDMVADVRKVANMVDLNSIQQQDRIRYGGYPDMPIVAEGGPYVGLVSPSDEHAVYTPVKKGGTEDITLETIKKDDIGAVQKIPSRIARASSRTMYKNVFDLLNPAINAVIYDGIALYNAAHNNTGTSALSSTGVELFAAAARMMKQTEQNSNEVIGIRPGYLLHPISLALNADQLTRGAYGVYNDKPTYLQNLGVQPLLVPYWEVASAKNWVLTPKREDGVPIEVGFVDGVQTPEIFVSDMNNVGSMFTNDKITYKVRFWYGYALIDYRYTDGSIVP